MADPTSTSTPLLTDGGIAGDHLDRRLLKVLTAPALDREFNTIQSGLFPIACWRVEDFRFAFDSSVVGPEIRQELAMLHALIDRHALADPTGRAPSEKPPLSIFGHADPVGADEYNKLLSGRRAQAIYALLTRRTDLWEDLYSHPQGGDDWKKGDAALRTMAEQVHAPTGPGPESDQARAERERRIEQNVREAARSPASRQTLFLAYMNDLCVDDQGKLFKMEKTDFLGRGADRGGKGDFQGCGEFNPVLLFSRAEAQRFEAAEDKTERNAANASNRRVVVLLFRPGVKVSVNFWPCPRAKEGPEGCRKRFWSDGQKRRSLQERRRVVGPTHETFACRFYHRLISGGPCERITRRQVFRYGVEMGVNFAWTDEAKLRILSEDGKQEKLFTKNQGVQAGTHRIFSFVEVRPGVKYKGSILDRKQEIEVFGFVELARVMDLADPLDVLPPPQPPEIKAGPEPSDPPPSVLVGPIADVDPDVDATALDPTADPQLSVPF